MIKKILDEKKFDYGLIRIHDEKITVKNVHLMKYGIYKEKKVNMKIQHLFNRYSYEFKINEASDTEHIKIFNLNSFNIKLWNDKNNEKRILENCSVENLSLEGKCKDVKEI